MVAAIKPRGLPMASPIKVDEEYNNALRTESYTDLYAKVHDHRLQRAASADTTKKAGGADDEEGSESQHRVVLHRTHSSLLPCRHHIPDFLVQPSQESLVAAVNSTDSRRRSRFHHHLDALLLDFFDATLQACIACSALLSSIERARSHHRSIHRLLLLLTLPSSTSDASFSQLSSHLELDNPLSPKNLSHFHRIHSRYPPLVQNLTSAHRKVVRRQRLVNFTKRASGMAVIALLGAAVVAAAVVATHAAVTIAVVPIAAAAAGGGRMRRKLGKWVSGWAKLERARARMDVATKGAYIVGRDLDTMSRIVTRVHDEVEHGRDVARMVVRNREWQMATEVVREMEGRGGEVGMGLEEQLEELEEHVYLCLITINRSRRLVAQEMMQPHLKVEVV